MRDFQGDIKLLSVETAPRSLRGGSRPRHPRRTDDGRLSGSALAASAGEPGALDQTLAQEPAGKRQLFPQR